MKRATAFALLLAIAVVSMFTSFRIEFAEAEGAVYIRQDGTVDPPTTPIQQDGNVYTFTANISKPIFAQRDNIIIDGNGYTLQGNGEGKGFDLSYRRNVTVRKVHIKNFNIGVEIQKSTGNIIENNTIANGVYGILASAGGAFNTSINNNIVANNLWDGIFLTSSNESMLVNNTVMNHGKWGIYLGYSAGITLRNNKIMGSRWNFGVSVNFMHDIDESNTVDGKPIYYWINEHDRQVPADAGYVALIDSRAITARDLNLTKNGQGILLVNSEGCLVENSIITKMAYYAIQLVDSDDNTLRRNNITDNMGGYFDVGIALQGQSTGNTITNNLIRNNGRGISLSDSSYNLIYHNNFVNNTVQASSSGFRNIWDNGYPSGGNYWSDYVGIDEKSGQDQNETGSDGIGDLEYRIDKVNIDRYPFMTIVQRQDDTISIDIDPTIAFVGIATIVTIVIAATLVHRTRRRPQLNSDEQAWLRTSSISTCRARQYSGNLGVNKRSWGFRFCPKSVLTFGQAQLHV